MKQNEYKTYQNLWDTANCASIEIFHTKSLRFTKVKAPNNLSSHFKKLEKEQNKPKLVRKNTLKINKSSNNWNPKENINDRKDWFFEKGQYNWQTSQKSQKKREDINFKCQEGNEILQQTLKISKGKGILWATQHISKFDNLNERD